MIERQKLGICTRFLRLRLNSDDHMPYKVYTRLEFVQSSGFEYKLNLNHVNSGLIIVVLEMLASMFSCFNLKNTQRSLSFDILLSRFLVEQCTHCWCLGVLLKSGHCKSSSSTYRYLAFMLNKSSGKDHG